MSTRSKLNNRRASLSFNFECKALRYHATVSFFPDGRLAEIFLTNTKPSS